MTTLWPLSQSLMLAFLFGWTTQESTLNQDVIAPTVLLNMNQEVYFAHDLQCDAIYYAMLSSKKLTCFLAKPGSKALLHKTARLAVKSFTPSRSFATGRDNDVLEFLFRFSLARDNCLGSAEYFKHFCITDH